MPENQVATTPKIVMIPLTDLVVPDWNPRQFMDEAPLQDLMNYIAKGRHIHRIDVWKGSGTAPFAVISGQRRLEAHRRLGRTTIEAEILDISIEEAKFLAITSNKDEKPYWLGEFIAAAALVGLEKYPTQKEVAERLEWTETRVSSAVILTKLFNPISRNLLNAVSTPKISNTYSQNDESRPISENSKVWRVPESVAVELQVLWDPSKPEESRDLAEKAVRQIIKNQLTAAQTAQLVASALEGKDLSLFQPPAKPRMGRPLKTASKPAKAAEPTPAIQTEVPAHHTHPAKLAEVGSVATSPLESTQSNTSSSLSKELVPPSHVAQPEASQQAPKATPQPVASTQMSKLSPEQMGTVETVALDALAGVSVIAKIKTKLKKGEKPTTAETLLLAGHALWTAIHWLGKHGFKLVKWLLKETWKMSKDGLKVLAKTWIGTIFKYAFAIFVIWFGVTAYMFGISYPLTAIGTFAVHHLKWKNADTPVEVAPATNADSSVPKPQVEEQALSVPNSGIQELGTAVPTRSMSKDKKVQVAEVPTVQTVATPNADSSINGESAQSNRVAQPVASQQTPQKKQDVLGDVAKGANAVGSAAKLFGL